MLLLHGNTASSAMFAQIAPALARTHKLVLIDFLGYGKSERPAALAQDLWYDEAMQLAAFLDEKGYREADVIGTSGGAIAALNLALERPDLVGRLIADSFEGECADASITASIRADRAQAKQNPGARAFFEFMNGADWESVIDADTEALAAHARNIGRFFHHPMQDLTCSVLFTGSAVDPMFPEGHMARIFADFVEKCPRARQHIFPQGDHPAMLSNFAEFLAISRDFFAESEA